MEWSSWERRVEWLNLGCCRRRRGETSIVVFSRARGSVMPDPPSSIVSHNLSRLASCNPVPWGKRVLDAAQARLQTWVVPQKHRAHRVIPNPIHAGLAIDLFGEIGCEEAIAVQPS